MMLFCFIVFTLIQLFGAQFFRPDYSYYEELNGWLKLHNIPENWEEAMFTCQLEGAILASPTDSKLLKTMISMTVTGFTTDKSVYTGIHSTFSTGQFFSVDGIPLAHIPVNWAPDEPNNVGGNEDCLILHSNGTVADVECSSVHPFFCFKNRTDDMGEKNECGTIDNEYKYSNITGSCYKFHKVFRNWQRSFKTCSAEGGYLAIANSQAEAEHLKAIHKEQLTSRTVSFLGFTFSDKLGTWLTNQGQTLKEAGYDKWADGEPNNMKSDYNNFEGEYCGSIDSNRNTEGLLLDVWCGVTQPFICEKEPDK